MARLTADFWVHAHSALLRTHNIPAYVIRRGDNTSGAVLVRLNFLDGHSQAFTQGYNQDNVRGWRPLCPKLPDEDVNTIVEKQLSYDPDLWILEIEDQHGRHCLEPLI